MTYPRIVEENSREMGFKAANKQFLYNNTAELNAALKERGIQVEVAVPPQYIFKYSFIREHLNLHAPMWLTKWEEFRKALATQTNKRSLEKPALDALAECAQIIKEVFEKHPLDDKDLSFFLNSNAKYMVRSTGHEDAIDKANPGGNVSIPCVNPNAEDISKAAMQVCISGLQLKSISQRLKSTIPGKEMDEFKSEPFFPVLLDEMIGSDPGARVSSGVIYSGNGCTRIQAAPGHGELIVNSLGNFDNFYITEDGRSYSEIMRKDFRLSPHYDEASGRNNLVKVKNSNELKSTPSLPEDVVSALHEISKEIEKLYGMKMDIEFVYDADKRIINLVQARAIPLGERLNMIPSSIHPGRIAQIKKDKSTRRGQVITPDVMRAQVITSPEEVIITPTIGEALDIYLTAKEETSRIKAVIVQQDAPDTSHEAGEFTYKGIPVLQVDNIHEIQQQVDTLASNQAVIVAPQHKLSTVITVEASGDIERECYSSHYLAEGIFRSAISSRVTPQAADFSSSSSRISFFAEPNLESVMTPGGLNSKIAAARNGDETAFNELMSYMYINLVRPGEASARKLNTAAMKERLDAIPDISFGKENNAQKKALADVVAFLLLLQRGLGKKDKKIDHAVFQQLMLTSLELFILINRAEQSKEDKTKQLDYLNLCEKFTGLITTIGKSDVFSNSMIVELQQEIIKKKALLVTPEARNLPIERQRYFIELCKVSHRIMNDANRGIWLDFCRSLFGVDSKQLKLNPVPFVTLISRLTKMGVLDIWLNTTFLDKVSEHKGDSKKIYLACLNDYTASISNNDEMMQLTHMIENHERQVAKWKDPEYYERAITEYQKMVELSSKMLVINQNDPMVKQMSMSNLLYRLTDLIDKTTKSLERSKLYQDEDLHVARFIKMLSVFDLLMKALLKQADIKYDFSWSIERELHRKNFKLEYLQIVDTFMKQEVKDYQLLINSITPIFEGALQRNIVPNKFLKVLLSRLMSDVFALMGNEVSPENLKVLRDFNELMLKIEIEVFLDDSSVNDQMMMDRIRSSGIKYLDRNKHYMEFCNTFNILIEHQSADSVIDISKIVTLWSDYQHEYLNQQAYLRYLSYYYQEYGDFLNGKPLAVKDHWWTRLPQEEFSMSGNFNYLGYVVSATGRIGPWNNITLEDLFTLIHQNVLNVGSNLSRGCSISSDRFPNDFVDRINYIQKIGNIGVMGFLPSLELVSQEFNYPFVSQLFNLNLRSHSASVLIKYNQQTKEMIAEVSAYGGGGNENCRWNNIEMRSNFFLRQYGIPVLKSPYYDEGKGVVSYSVSIPDDSCAQNLSKCLSDLALASFKTNVDDGLFFLGKNAESAPLKVLLEVQSVLMGLMKRHSNTGRKYIETRLNNLDIQIGLKEINENVQSGNYVAAGAMISEYLDKPQVTVSFVKKLIELMTRHLQDEPWKNLLRELSRMDLNNNPALITFLQKQETTLRL